MSALEPCPMHHSLAGNKNDSHFFALMLYERRHICWLILIAGPFLLVSLIGVFQAGSDDNSCAMCVPQVHL